MKYQKTIEQISDIFSRYTPEEQIELISLSPVLNKIYKLGAQDFKNFIEKDIENKGIYSSYIDIGGYEVDTVDFNGFSAINDFIKHKKNKIEEGIDFISNNNQNLIEKAYKWFNANWRKYIDIDADGMIRFSGWKNDFKKAMEE